MLPQKYPSRRSVIWVFICTVLLYTIIGFFMTTASGSLVPNKWLLFFGGAILPLPAYLYLRHGRYDIRVIFRLNLVSRRVMGLSLALGLAAFFLTHQLNSLINIVLPFPEEYRARFALALTANSASEWILIFLALVILPGIFEEIVFRGFVQNTFERYHQPLIAICITAAIFAATHGLLWWLLQIFTLGVLLGWMAWKSDSIIPSAIVHAINNLLAVLFENLKLAPSWLFWQGWGQNHVQPVLLAVAALIIYFCLQFFNRFCEEETELPTFLNTPL